MRVRSSNTQTPKLNSMFKLRSKLTSIVVELRRRSHWHSSTTTDDDNEGLTWSPLRNIESRMATLSDPSLSYINREWPQVYDQYWRDCYHLLLSRGYTLRPHFKPVPPPPADSDEPRQTYHFRPMVRSHFLSLACSHSSICSQQV